MLILLYLRDIKINYLLTIILLIYISKILNKDILRVKF